MVKRKVQVWIYFRNLETSVYSFLLLKTRPDRGGFWQPVTGGVKANEGLPEAALREAQEETGIAFTELPEALGSPFEFKGRGNHQFTEQGFSLQINAPEASGSPPSIRIDPKEHIEYQWVTGKAAFKTVGFPSNATVLKDLLMRLAKQ